MAEEEDEFGSGIVFDVVGEPQAEVSSSQERLGSVFAEADEEEAGEPCPQRRRLMPPPLLRDPYLEE